jgi:rhodanese-related sulfurtransferase
VTYAGDLTPREAWDLLARDDEAVLVDVRSEAEWTFVGVPDLTALGRKFVPVSWSHWPGGALNDTFVEDLRAAGVAPGTPVVFLCRSGARSRNAAVAATAAGLSPAYNVSEGFEGDVDADGHRGRGGWKSHGLPWQQA